MGAQVEIVAEVLLPRLKYKTFLGVCVCVSVVVAVGYQTRQDSHYETLSVYQNPSKYSIEQKIVMESWKDMDGLWRLCLLQTQTKALASSEPKSLPK